MTLSLPSSREFLPPRCAETMAEAFRLGKIRKILMPVFRLRQTGSVGLFRPKPGRRRPVASVISDTCFFELAAVQVAAG
jgi:hypothetical protein